MDVDSAGDEATSASFKSNAGLAYLAVVQFRHRKPWGTYVVLSNLRHCSLLAQECGVCFRGGGCHLGAASDG